VSSTCDDGDDDDDDGGAGGGMTIWPSFNTGLSTAASSCEYYS